MEQDEVGVDRSEFPRVRFRVDEADEFGDDARQRVLREVERAGRRCAAREERFQHEER